MTATYPQVLLKHRKPDRITTLAEYREAGGFEALRRVLTEMDRQEVKTLLADALLLVVTESSLQVVFDGVA